MYKIKVLLLQPPVQDFYDTDIRLQPLGLCYLKATIKKYLPEVEVIVKDFHHGRGRRTVAIPKPLTYLKDYYPWPDRSPFCTFHNYYHFGADFADIIKETKAISPDIIGISSLFSPYYREVLTIARMLKEHIQADIVVGGSHASAAPLSLLQDPAIDFIIRGEGERPIVEFLKTWASDKKWCSVPNLGYKENKQCLLNNIEENYPLADIPIPDFSDLDWSHYQYHKRPLTFIITSRSCPHRCTFCSVHLTFGYKYRRREISSIMEEIKERYRQGCRVIDFEDDNLTFRKEEIKQLCREIIVAFPKNDLQLLAMNGISHLSLDQELLLLMKQAGFTHLNLALVTADQKMRKQTKRPHSMQQYLDVVKHAGQMGFHIVSYQILGLPGETLDSMIQTLALNAQLPVLLGASMFYLTPNSPIAKNFPDLSSEQMFKSRLTAMAIETKDFQREDIYSLFVTTRIINFLKGIKTAQQQITLEQAFIIAKQHGQRTTTGVELLEKLLKEKKLYACCSDGIKLLPRFHPEVFFSLWHRLKHIITCEGMVIKL